MKLDRNIKINIIKGLQCRLELLCPDYGNYLRLSDIADVLCYAVYGRPYRSIKYPALEYDKKVFLNNIYLYLLKKGLFTKSRTGKTLKISDKIVNWKGSSQMTK